MVIAARLRLEIWGMACSAFMSNSAPNIATYSRMLSRFPVGPFLTLLVWMQAIPWPAVAERTDAPNPPRVILLIGDGMGFEALGLLRINAQIRNHSPSQFERALEKGRLTLMQPRPTGSLVIDSACSATELASGVDALPETLGLNERGERVESIAEAAKARGMAVGIVSDTRLTHATPAAFAAHLGHRSSENEIAEQMLESRFDVLLSGGLQHFVPAGASFRRSRVSRSLNESLPAGFNFRSARKDNLDLLARARSQGYSLVFDREGLVNFNLSGPLLGLFASSAMQDAIEERRAQSHQPSLAEMTERTLAVLERNPKGFFAMIESGQIDWAEHSNDAGLLLHEMERFDGVLGAILKWINDHPEATLVVTADHSTGGFGFSYTREGVPTPRPFAARPDLLYAPQHNFGDPKILELLARQPQSFARFFAELTLQNSGLDARSRLRDLLHNRLGFDLKLEEIDELLKTQPRSIADGAKAPDEIWPAVHDFSAFYSEEIDRRTALLARITASRTGIVWSTGSHTSAPVPFLVIGRCAPVPKAFLSATQAGEFLRGCVLGTGS